MCDFFDIIFFQSYSFFSRSQISENKTEGNKNTCILMCICHIYLIKWSSFFFCLLLSLFESLPSLETIEKFVYISISSVYRFKFNISVLTWGPQVIIHVLIPSYLRFSFNFFLFISFLVSNLSACFAQANAYRWTNFEHRYFWCYWCDAMALLHNSMWRIWDETRQEMRWDVRSFHIIVSCLFVFLSVDSEILTVDKSK